MADNTIIQKIILDGGKEIEASLKSMGKTGDEAFKQIGASAKDVGNAGIGGITNLRNTVRGTTPVVQQSAAAFTNIRNVIDTFGATSKEAARSVHGISAGAADAVSGVKGLSDASDQAGVTVGATDVALIRLAQTGRLLGRALRIPVLSQLSRVLGVVGRAAQIAIPALLVSGLAKLAKSAAGAADEVADLAIKNKLSLEGFQEFTSVSFALGGGVDDAGRAVSGLNSTIKETAQNVKQNNERFQQFKDTMKELREKTLDLGFAFETIKTQQTITTREFLRNQRLSLREDSNSSSQFLDSLEKIKEARDDLRAPPTKEEQQRRQLRDLDRQEAQLREQESIRGEKVLHDRLKAQEDYTLSVRKTQEELRKNAQEQEDNDKKIRETQKAFAEARVEMERNATALEKLGINVVNTNGQLKKAPFIILEVADALANVTDEEKRTKIEQDLVAAGIDRKLLPALRRGRQGFLDLKKEGDAIRPPFNKEQIKVADDFLIVLGKLAAAFGGIKDAIGLAAAPAFTQFLELLLEIVTRNREAIIQFALSISNVVSPVLQGLFKAVTTVVTVFRLLFTAISKIAKLFFINADATDVFVLALVGLAFFFARIPVLVGIVVAAFGKLFDFINNLGFNEFVTTGLQAIAVLTAGFAAFVLFTSKKFLGLALVFGSSFAFIRSIAIAGWVALQAIFVGGIAKIGTAIVGLVGGFARFIPVLAVIAVAALAFFAVWNNWDTVKQFALDTFKSISTSAKAFWQDLQTGFAKLMTDIAPLFGILKSVGVAAFEGLSLVVTDVIVPAFKGLMGILNDVAQFINDTFGTSVTGTQLLVGALGALAFAFLGLPAIIASLVTAIGLLAKGFKENQFVLVLIGVAIIALVAAFATIPAAIAAVIAIIAAIVLKWDDLKKAGGIAVDFLKEKWEEFKEFFSGGFFSVVGKVIDKLVAGFKRLTRGANEAQGAVAEAGGPPPDVAGNARGGIITRARGGAVWGRGTSTSDSILGWLSDGEFVTQTKAVKYYGLGFMKALNSMQIPRNALRGFSIGGLVERLALDMPSPMRFATGGSVAAGNRPSSGMRPVNLHFGNDTFRMMASEDVAESLTRLAIGQQLRSAGRKPQYFGRGSR